MDRDAYLEHVATVVDEHGVCIQHVGAGDGEPSFAYTVGLSLRDHPELIVFDLPQRLAHELLDDLAQAVLRAGMRFDAGDRVHRLIEGGAGWLLGVQEPEDHLGVAIEVRAMRIPGDAPTSLAALQLVLPDAEGRWPWDPEAAPPEAPLLGPAPPTGGRDQELPPAEIRRAQGW